MKVNSGGPFQKGHRIGVDKNRFKVRERERVTGGKGKGLGRKISRWRGFLIQFVSARKRCKRITQFTAQ
jgi:hypothetical protein